MSKRKWRKSTNAALSLGLAASLLVPALPSPVQAATTASDLLISEYIEGGSHNKAIELYNGTSSAIDLSQYALELYSNGKAPASQSLELSGTLEAGDTYVLYHQEANDSIKAAGNLENSSVINFNGNDPVVLKKDEAVIDSIGQVGSSADFAKDVTLVRNASVTSGDTVIDNAFNPANEWTSFPKDTFDQLGSHTMDGSAPGPDPDSDPDPDVPGEIMSIEDARNSNPGEVVTIKGIVAANLKNTISVQDATGGIAVRPVSLDAKVGDEVVLTGTLADYRGLMQLDQASIVEKTANAGNPAPQVVTGAEVNEESESELVTVENVKLVSADDGGTWANFVANDGTVDFIVRDETNELGLQEGMDYDSITGIVQQFDAEYQVIPRSVQDIVADSSVIQPVFATPGSGTFVGGTSVILETQAKDAEIYYTLNGSDPTTAGTLYSGPIEITEDTTLKAVVKSGDTFSEVKVFDYKITDSLEIHDIQGAGHASPMDGATVENIEGVVTAEYVLSGSTYYHIQTPDELTDNDPKTSEAILLYSGRTDYPIEVGDLVAATGAVSEYAVDGYSDRQETDLKTTQINVRNDQGGKVEVVENGVALPKAFVINENNIPTEAIDSDGLKVFNPETDATDFWESLEGMRVETGNVKAVSPQENGDLVTVLEEMKTDTLHGGILLKENDENPERIQFRLDPNGPARDFEVATGDLFEGPIEGVVGYSYQNYKIFTSLSDMEAAHVKGTAAPETTTIEKVEDKLTIASYNLENFSNNTSETSNDKAQKLARAFAKDMKNPDIIGVTEVQDNNGGDAGSSEAAQSYERLINEIKRAGGVEYEYVNIDPIANQDGGAPDANIRVGFLYNPERVSLTEGASEGDATTAVGYEDGKLTHNPGRIDPENEAFDNSRKPLAAQFDFQGESVVVIANHWNSKGGDTPTFGSQQPPELGSQEQRNKIAGIVAGFVEEVKTENPDANVVAVGDFNDFQFAEPLKILESKHMANMIHKVEEKDRYSYVFQGNSQVLDHILVSNNLAGRTAIDILHVNADFTDMAGRASDHDPVMVQIDLGGKVEEPGEPQEPEQPQEPELEPIEAEKTYSFKNLKTKKLTINKPSVSITLDGVSSIKEGLVVTGEYAEFHGAGFADTKVIAKPKGAGAILDFNGIEAGHVVIDGANVAEIRGAENIRNIEFINGAKHEDIKFYNAEGEPIGSPHLPAENGQAGYYAGAYGKTGETLKQSLHEIIDDHTELSYKQVWEALKETDEDPNNPNNVLLLYSGESRSKSLQGGNVGNWNREHTWAKSHGDFGTSKGAGTDIHHLRPTDVQVNSSRGNLDFANGGSAVKGCDDCKRTSNSWEPPNEVKGDVARMIFYMAVRYEQGDDVDLELNEKLNNGKNPYHGKLSVLLEWHEQDPVSEWELTRNDKIEDWQGNRNPFIDHPEWAEEIWDAN